jgi:hypothetical protein
LTGRLDTHSGLGCGGGTTVLTVSLPPQAARSIIPRNSVYFESNFIKERAFAVEF